jgi:hypothetical protein
MFRLHSELNFQSRYLRDYYVRPRQLDLQVIYLKLIYSFCYYRALMAYRDMEVNLAHSFSRRCRLLVTSFTLRPPLPQYLLSRRQYAPQSRSVGRRGIAEENLVALLSN